MSRLFGARRDGDTFFTATALVCSLAVVAIFLLQASHEAPVVDGRLSVSLTPVWLLLGVAIPLVAVLANVLRFRRASSFRRWTVLLALTIVSLAAVALAASSGGVLATAVACAEFGLFWAARPHGAAPEVLVPAAIAIACSWMFAAGMPFTRLGDMLLGATPASATALPAFVTALLLGSFVLMRPRPMRDVSARLRWGVAAAAFIVLAARVDNEGAKWVPYHQSYFAAPAALVRDHHWLLWDIPSQYGFASVLAIALAPGATSIDALHTLVSAVLIVQSALLFWLLTFRRASPLHVAFALALVTATFWSSQTAQYPFGARLYPQEGLRFVWPIALLCIAFCRYRYRAPGAQRATLIGGHVCWLFGLAWSFETGVWSTLVWFGLLAGEFVRDLLLTNPIGRPLRRASVVLLAAGILLVATVTAVEAVYRIALGHGPDWQSYIEYSALYSSSNAYVQAFALTGPGWILLGVDGAILCVALVAMQLRQYRLLPLLAATWCAVWGTSIYYAGEAFDDHVAVLSGMLVFAGAIVSIVTSRHQRGQLAATLARVSFIPLYVLLITYAFGAPSHIRAAVETFTFRSIVQPSDGLPRISGELAHLLDVAGIGPDDRVIFPNDPNWVEVSRGLILPLRVAADGRVYEQLPWLPVSPVGLANTYMTLPFPRRGVYVDRFLHSRTGARGWYITYRTPATCAQLAPRLTALRSVTTENYTAMYCTLASDERSKHPKGG